MSINDGGPAFPSGDSVACERLYGMTLRDYFAGRALVGIVQNNQYGGELRRLFDRDEEYAKAGVPNESAQTYMARIVYSLADAMLAARGAK